MSSKNHFYLLKHYQENIQTINNLMESMMASINGLQYLSNTEAQQELVKQLGDAYPFIELIYSVDESGVQIADTAYAPDVSERHQRRLGIGSDRSDRPYMIAARESSNRVIITKPYLSTATHKLSISAVQHIINRSDEGQGYLIINFNLQRLVSYLSGNELSRNIHPWFKLYYGIVGSLLIAIAILLVYAAVSGIYHLFTSDNNFATESFGIVVLITLGMSIFDLGKTILEEEVLFDKSLGRSEATRHTITRFMTAIIIAVSIEALLLMFKSLYNGSDDSQIIEAVLMLMSSVGLLVGLGLYNYLTRQEKKE